MIRINDYELIFREQKLILTPEKALFWVEKNALILSDVHLGKSGYFRKSGIAVPESVNDNNLVRLTTLINHFKPNQVLFLGDLFHSDKNSEWNSFHNWRIRHSEIQMHLVIGNHDFHPVDEYESIGLHCSSKIEAYPFLMLHDSKDSNQENTLYTISGHIHPAVQLKGKGRQSIRVPCFYFGEAYALLPAFGSFTGNHTIKPKIGELIFGIVNNEITRIS